MAFSQFLPNTAAGRTILAAADAAAQRDALGLGTADSPTFAGGTFTGTLEANILHADKLRSTDSDDAYWSGYGFVLSEPTIRAQNVNVLTISRDGVKSQFRMLSGPVNFVADGAGIFSQRNGLNEQSSRVYNTYTDASNGEWFEIDWQSSSNVCRLAPSANGTGSVRALQIGGKVDGTFTSWLSFDTSGLASVNTTFSVNRQGRAYLRNSNNTADDALVLGTSRGTVNTLEIEAPALGVGLVRINSDLIVEQDITASGTIDGRASTTAAGTAPLKLATGVLMTTPEAGAIEYDGTNLYFTDSGGTRRTLAVV